MFNDRHALTFRLLAVVLVLLLLPMPGSLAALSLPPQARALGEMARLPGHVLPALTGATPVAPTPGAEAEPLTLTVVLSRTDQAGFERYLHEVYDPTSPQFRHFLSQGELTARFGPMQEAYEGVLAYLRDNGFTLVQGSENRLTLTVRGTRAQAEHAFGVRIRDFEAGGRRFFANDTDPAVPPSLAKNIQAVMGLSNLADPMPASVALGIGLSILFAALLLAILYNTFKPQIDGFVVNTVLPIINQLNQVSSAAGASSPTGAGQKIGIPAFSRIQLSDVADWLALVGLPANLINQVSQVPVNGGAPFGPDQNDVLLAINTILTIAPGAQIVVYHAPFAGPGTSFQMLFNAMINDHVTIISNSFSYCEDQTTLADVQSIDAILATAAASGITVFNATGDSGSACRDGTANTIAVPANSPNATAVGGTSLTFGPGFTYGGETWWNGSTQVPPTGQGGFGISRFFARPTYQNGLISNSMRSVPDVAAPANPELGVKVCEADAGGCPTGPVYGGTSLATPLWAAFTARINERVGHSLGFLNPLLYPLAGTSVFHSSASMGTDAAHVGLGSPIVNPLELALAGLAPGPANASLSSVTPSSFPDPRVPFLGIVPADGTTAASIVVSLRDADRNLVIGKTVTLAASPGSHAVIIPTSGVSTAANGTVVFTVTDANIEDVTFTATDTTDGIVLQQTPRITFTVPAASAGINVFPTSVAADGVNTTTIAVTLRDASNRPTPGKLITLSQGSGHSVIDGPNPSVTDSNGQIQFTAVDQVAETVTYTAIDATDGNLSIPGSGTVTFTGGPANGCGNGNPIAAPGFLVTPYATGFIARNFSFGNVNFGGCPGAFGIAFDGSGNLYVSDAPTGNIYKFPPGGGVANSSTLLTSTPIGPSLFGLALDTSGHLFAGRDATTAANPNFTTGAVLQIDPTTGVVLRTVASGLKCPGLIAFDPLSGDLFTDDSCSGNGSDNESIFRIADPSGSSPTTTVYATVVVGGLPVTPNATLAFAPSGTIYVWARGQIARVSGTNGPSTPTVSLLPGLSVSFLGLLAEGMQANGDADFLVVNFPANGGVPGSIGIVDLTTNPPALSTTLVSSGVTNNNLFARGPDGCVYTAQGDAVFKITDTTGACTYTSVPPAPTFVLAPRTVSPNPAQGTSEVFTATFHHVSVPAGTPVTLIVLGPNFQSLLARTDATGRAAFTYAGTFTGTDDLVATATVGTQTVTSNVAQVTWTPGPHTTFLSLNASRSSSTVNTPLPLTATLVDVSVSPSVAPSNATLSFTLAGQTCTAITNSSGTASCTLTPTVAGGSYPLTSTFTGTNLLLASAASKTVDLVATANRLPDCSQARPSDTTLWPPNHKMVSVSVQGVKDPDGDPVTVRVTQILQDEPTNGTGSGDTCPDAGGIGSTTALVRAERSGTGNGRVYSIRFTATDGQGGSCQGHVQVCVPHDQGQGSSCVDGGPLFDATKCP